MKTTFTKSTAKFGCYKSNDNQQDNYLPNETFTISDVLNAEVSLKDKAWFIRYNCEFTDTQFREFAIGCALCVLQIYEEKYPDNKAPREGIEGAKAYLAGKIDIDEFRLKRRAAAEAADAAASVVRLPRRHGLLQRLLRLLPRRRRGLRLIRLLRIHSLPRIHSLLRVLPRRRRSWPKISGFVTTIF